MCIYSRNKNGFSDNNIIYRPTILLNKIRRMYVYVLDELENGWMDFDHYFLFSPPLILINIWSTWIYSKFY